MVKFLTRLKNTSWPCKFQIIQISGWSWHYCSSSNVNVEGSPYKVKEEDAAYKNLPKESALPANPIDASIDKWFFISGQPSL